MRSKKTKTAVQSFNSQYAIINSFLLSAALALLAYYVVGANALASSNYKIKVLKDRLTQINDERGALLSQKAGLEESLFALEYAKANNMVEAKNISYIFKNKTAALKR